MQADCLAAGGSRSPGPPASSPTRKLADTSAADVDTNIAVLVDAVDALHASLPFKAAPAVGAAVTAPFVQVPPPEVPVPLLDTPDVVPASAGSLVATADEADPPADDGAGALEPSACMLGALHYSCRCKAWSAGCRCAVL